LGQRIDPFLVKAAIPSPQGIPDTLLDELLTEAVEGMQSCDMVHQHIGSHVTWQGTGRDSNVHLLQARGHTFETIHIQS